MHLNRIKKFIGPAGVLKQVFNPIQITEELLVPENSQDTKAHQDLQIKFSDRIVRH